MKYEISLDENIFLTDVNITVVFLVDVLSRDGSGSLRHVTRLLLQLLELSEQLGGVLSCGIDVFLQLLVGLEMWENHRYGRNLRLDLHSIRFTNHHQIGIA